MIPEKLGELLRGKLLPTTVEQYQRMSSGPCLAAAELEQGRLIFERRALDIDVARQALQVFVGQRLDG